MEDPKQLVVQSRENWDFDLMDNEDEANPQQEPKDDTENVGKEVHCRARDPSIPFLE
jgi:hypothetical protein